MPANTAEAITPMITDQIKFRTKRFRDPVAIPGKR
jgi:hypothetical protein